MDTYWSNRKIVVSGNIVESYTYLSKNFQHGAKRIKPKLKVPPDEQKAPSEARNQEADRINLNRARRGVRRLINSNASILTKFVTLTFADNITQADKANYEYKKFIERLKTWLKKEHPDHELSYIAVIEFQKRGAVHYHVLFNLPFIKNKELSDIWGNGFVKINEIKHVDNVGSYVTKYMTKDERDERLWGKKMYFTSRNLEKPYEFTEKEEVRVIEESMLHGLTPNHSNTHENDFIGLVRYEQYNLNRK